MTRFKYKCDSKCGASQAGEGKTEFELGSEDHTRDLLNEIALMATKAELPWDPFNVKLTVWAQTEPKPLHKIVGLSFEDLIKFLESI